MYEGIKFQDNRLSSVKSLTPASKQLACKLLEFAFELGLKVCHWFCFFFPFFPLVLNISFWNIYCSTIHWWRASFKSQRRIPKMQVLNYVFVIISLMFFIPNNLKQYLQWLLLTWSKITWQMIYLSVFFLFFSDRSLGLTFYMTFQTSIDGLFIREPNVHVPQILTRAATYPFLVRGIHRMHKWRLNEYSFIWMLIRLTSLIFVWKFFCIFRLLTRLVRLISTKIKE